MRHCSYNVVLLPNSSLSKEVVRLSRKIASKFPVEFILDKNHYPHLTLYQVEIPDKNFKIVQDLLSDIFKKSLSVKFDHYFGSNNGFVSLDCQNAKDLYTLHHTIVNKLNQYREGEILPSKKFKYDLSDKDYLQVENFGTSGLFENFRPHITITRLKQKSDYKKALKVLPLRKPVMIKLERAALGKLSIHGTVPALLKEYRLT